jgi:CRP/FNR family cyclic AMP-dependent transcriptional regulator
MESQRDWASLGGLAADEWARLKALGVVRRFSAGVPIIHEGDQSDHVFVIRRGCVKVVASPSPAGGEFILGIRGPGDVIGELAGLDGRPRRGTVVAIDHVETLLVPGIRFLQLLSERPAISLAIARIVAARLAEADHYRQATRAIGVGPALAQLMLDLAARYGSRTAVGGWTLGVALTQRDLADCLAVSQRTVARTIAAWRRAGTITTARRGIVIRDPAALRSRLAPM